MKNMFYSGLMFETKEVVDKRLYIDGLSETSLRDTFGVSGRYAGRNIFTFNTQDEKFYKLVDDTDPLNPTSWKKLTDSLVVFPDFMVGETYVKGSCVMFMDSFNRIGFYISLVPTKAGQSPETHPQLWFDLSASTNTTGDAFRESVLHRLNPTDANTHTINVFFDKNNLPDGTSPIVVCYVDLKDSQEGQIGWVRCFPSMVTWGTGSLIKIKIEFSGDLSDINFSSSTPQQTNVKLVIM